MCVKILKAIDKTFKIKKSLMILTEINIIICLKLWLPL